MHRSDKVVLGAAAAVDAFVAPMSRYHGGCRRSQRTSSSLGGNVTGQSPGPAGRPYSDSYLNDNWILVR